MPIIAFIARSRNAQIVALIIAVLACFTVWRVIHDHNIRKEERARIEAKTIKESEKAAHSATDKKEVRDEEFRKSQSNLSNAGSPDDWASRLRVEQCRAGKIASPC